MTDCYECGTEIDEDDQFCHKCGARISEITSAQTEAKQNEEKNKDKNYGIFSTVFGLIGLILSIFVPNIMVSIPLGLVFGSIAIYFSNKSRKNPFEDNNLGNLGLVLGIIVVILVTLIGLIDILSIVILP